MNKNNYSAAVAWAAGCFASEVKRAVVDQIANDISERADAIERLLDNGRDIFQLATGERFHRIYHQRQKMFIKLDELHRVGAMLYKV